MVVQKSFFLYVFGKTFTPDYSTLFQQLSWQGNNHTTDGTANELNEGQGMKMEQMWA